MLARRGPDSCRPTTWSGIKINASGAPQICSRPEVVGEIARNLVEVGVKPENIWVHERFNDQVRTVKYADFLPKGAHVVTADSQLGYDPFTYVETSFFGEDDTRSNLVRLVSDKLTKIINVPNMKDHSASGVTGCLKNIAYGEFSNVARSHQYSETNTYSFIGTLAAVEPLRTRTVLHVMDGLKGVWHGGPFAWDRKFWFYPKQLLIGTDPVAVDRLLLDVINDKRTAEKAISVWDRSPKSLEDGQRKFRSDPNANIFIREPGHIEYAGNLGLGVYDKSRIKVADDPAVMRPILIAAVLTGLLWRYDIATAEQLKNTRLPRVHVSDAAAAEWRQKGVEVAAAPEIAGYVRVPPPTSKMLADQASATTVPWVESNGWRFMRGLSKALYEKVPAGRGALAAAEAYAYGVDAVIEAAREDLPAVSAHDCLRAEARGVADAGAGEHRSDRR